MDLSRLVVGVRFCMLVLCAVVTHVTSSVAEPIRSADTLEINVMEWDPIVTGGMRPWAGWTTNYVVDTEGNIDVPFLNTTIASGLPTSELAATIAERLTDQLALSERLAVTVRVLERRPVFVSGFVREPGMVKYLPNMTAREALARAGGPILGSDIRDPLRQRLEAQNLIEDLTRQEDELAARKARLEAEVDGQSEVLFAPFIGSAQSGAILRAQEERLFRLNLDQAARRLDLIDGRVALLVDEIASLGKKMELIDAQLVLAQEQTAATQQLAERGLSSQVRVIDSQSRLAALQIQNFDTRSAILAAEQDISSAETDRLDAVEGLAAQRLSQLQTTIANLADVRAERRLQLRLMQTLHAINDPDAALQAIVRRADGDVMTGLDVALEAGDFLEIRLKQIDSQ